MNRPKNLLLSSLLATTLLHATPNCQQIYKVQSFAQRFYAEVLGRQPDNAGLDSWTNALTSRTKTGADVANGFIFSQEFINKHTSDDAFMTTLYKAFFNRNPDPDGFAYWKTKLAEGMSREEVSHGFIYSSEFANLSSEYGIQAYEGAAFSSVALDNFVKRFYSVILGRDADAGGLAYWTGLLSTGAGTGAEIAKGFIFSPEYNIESKTNTQYLNDLYSAFFDRAADTAGFDGWMTQLNSGTSRAEVLDGFLGSQEFINLTNSYGILAFKGAPAPDTSGNVAPVAEAGEDMMLSYGEAIHLDGSQSTDADGSLACYWWATPYELLSETETYTSYGTIGAGRYNIRLTVVDDAGVSSSDSVQITITKPDIQIKKTGQIKSYNEDGDEVTDGSLKDDGFYQKGVEPSYTRDDATDIVIDHITNLEWADDADVSSVTKPWLTQTNYDICGGENGQTQDTSKCTDTSGDTATTYCANLTLGGHTDWRLPSIDELMNIADRSKQNPAIDTSYFQNVVSDGYWSSTTVVGDENGAWSVGFNYGNDDWGVKSYSGYVRCVRDGQ